MPIPLPAFTGSPFMATGVSAPFVVYGQFLVSIWGTPLNGDGTPGSFVGTVRLERSGDQGTTYLPVSIDGAGTPATYSGSVVVEGEDVNGAYYRFNCVGYTSGTINYSAVGTIAVAP